MCFYFCLYFLSLCIYEYIHRVCVYKWTYCWVKKIYTDLPTLFFSNLLHQYNNNNKIGPKQCHIISNMACWLPRLILILWLDSASNHQEQVKNMPRAVQARDCKGIAQTVWNKIIKKVRIFFLFIVFCCFLVLFLAILSIFWLFLVCPDS